MSGDLDLKRYKRLFKLTGDFGWISKYAEEEKKQPGSGMYTLPTVADFITWLVQGNSVPLPGNHTQGLLGEVASKVLADYYSDNLDPDEVAFRDIDLKEDLGAALSKSLLAFEEQDLAKIKATILKNISKLKDEPLSSYAEKLDDDGLDDLIKFTLIRGYISTYWMFIFNNPIVSIMLESQGQEKAETPLTLNSFLHFAADPEKKRTRLRRKNDDFTAKEVKEVEKKEEQLDQEIHKEIEDAPEERDRTQREQEFLSYKHDRVRLSHVLEGFKILRLKYFKKIEEAMIRRATYDELHLLRIDYFAADGTVKYLENVKKSIEVFLASNPKNKFRTFMGQPLAGADGKGDIWVGKIDPVNPWKTLADIHEGSFLRYSGIEIPWVDVDGNAALFGSSDDSLEGKYIGKIIPKHEDILVGYVYDQYADKETKDGVISGKEKLAQDTKLKVWQDSKLLMNYVERSAAGRQVKMSKGGSLMTAKNLIFSRGISEQDLIQASNVLYDIIVSATKSHVASARSPEELSKGYKEVYKKVVQDVSMIPLPLQQDWESRMQTLITDVYAEIGIVPNLDMISSAFGHTARDDVMNKASGNVDRKIAEALNLFDPEITNELQHEIFQRIEATVLEVDRKVGFVPTSGHIRDPKPYIEQLQGKVRVALEEKYLKYVKMQDGEFPKKTIVNSKAKSKKYKSPIADLITLYAKSMYPDAAVETWGVTYVAYYLAGAKGGTIFNEKKNEFSFNFLSGPTKEITEASIGPDLFEELKRELSRQGRPARLSQGLVKRIKQALIDNKIVYTDPSGNVFGPDTIVNNLLQKFGNINSFTHNAAKDLATILGSKAYDYSGWREEAKKAQEKADTKLEKKRSSESVQKYYHLVKDDWQRIGLPKKLMTFKGTMLNRSNPGDHGLDKQEWEDTLMETRQWIQRYTGVEGDPNAGMKELFSKAYPDQAFDPSWAQGVFTVVGEKLFALLNSRRSYGTKKNPFGLPDLEYHIWKRFSNARPRGAPGLHELRRSEAIAANIENFGAAKPGANAKGVSSEMVQSGDAIKEREHVNKKARGLYEENTPETQQAQEYVMMMGKNMFDTVFTRRTAHELNLEREQGIQHNRPMVALSSQGYGGWIQQMMGHSLSKGLPQYLQSNHGVLAWFGSSAGMSFGNNVLHQVVSDLKKLYTNERNEMGIITRAAPYEDVWELMEDVGAFADPTWAFKAISQAFKHMQRRKMKSGAVENDPDSAYDHLIRIAYNLDEITVDNLRKGFQGRLEDIQKSFSNVDPKKIETYLIIPFKKDDKEATNSPFRNMTPEEMGQKFEKIGLTPDMLEVYFGYWHRRQMLEKAEGYAEFMHLPSLDSLTDQLKLELKYTAKLESLADLKVSHPDDISRILQDTSVSEGNEELLEEAIEAVQQGLKSLTPKKKQEDITVEDQERWLRLYKKDFGFLKDALVEIIGNLPPHYDPVKQSLLDTVSEMADANQSWGKIYSEYESFARVVNTNIEAVHKEIEEKEKEMRRQLEEGDVAQVEEISEDIEDVKEELPEETNPHVTTWKDVEDVDEELQIKEVDQSPGPVVQRKPVTQVQQKAPSAPRTVIRRDRKPAPTQFVPEDTSAKTTPYDIPTDVLDPGDDDDEDKDIYGAVDQRFAKNESPGLVRSNIKGDIWDDGDNYYFV